MDDETISHEKWTDTPAGASVERRSGELLKTLLQLDGNERILDVGCTTDRHLEFFRHLGCRVTGIEREPCLVAAAGERLGGRTSVHLGDFEDLPFSDNEFDVTTLIMSLESARNPRKALSEAVRVSRKRVYVSLFNRASLSGSRLRNCALPRCPEHFFSLFDMLRMARSLLSDVPVTWGSALFFPLHWYPRAEELDRRVPMKKNPFGSVAALSFPVRYRYRTLQEPLRVTIKTDLSKGGRIPGTACNREKARP